jgi:hypothetical protein
MDEDKIVLWAIKAHMEASAADENCRVSHFDDVTLEELEAFAKLAAAHEREAIAADADWCIQNNLEHLIPERIRARGNT